jgi:hypothetical protein
VPIFDGVVTVDDDEVPVIIGLEDDGIRMSTNGTEIGEWATGEFSIDHHGDGVYTITADNETIRFVPNRPDLFAAGVGHPRPTAQAPAPAPAPRQPEDEARHMAEDQADGAPPPKPLTRALFYTLAGTTAALGLWALTRLVF